MPTATPHTDLQPSSSTEFESETSLVVEPATPPVDDWWTRPRGPRSPRGRVTGGRISASTSLGSAGFASFREVGVGLVGVSELSVGEGPSEPIIIATPLRRASSRAASSAASPANSSPASQFLSAFSPPKDVIPEDDGPVVGGYTLGKKIGEGAFSEVRKATNTDTGAVVAVKIIKKDKPGSSLGERESAIWFHLSHEHVLPLFSTFDTPYATYLVMLYCPSGSLLSVLNTEGAPGLSHPRAGALFVQIVAGLKYLHTTAHIVHGDLKLENVLLDEHGQCRLADFGLSRPIGAPVYSRPPSPPEVDKLDGLMRSHTMPRHRPAPKSHMMDPYQRRAFHPGSLEYAAPELLRVSPSTDADVADPSQDIWALGCILHALLTGRLPFADTFLPRLQMKIVRGTWDVPAHIGRRATELLKGCLEMHVLLRLSVNQVDQSAWVARWKERSRSPPHGLHIRGRSTSRDAYHSSGSRPRQDRKHSWDAGPRSSSLSPTRGISLPSFPRSDSNDGSLPPLSPPVASLYERHGFFEHSRSPSLGTPGPGTPVDGHSPLNKSNRSTSRGRPRIISPLSIAGLEVLEEGNDGLSSASSVERDSEPRGRRTTQRRLVSSPSPLHIAHAVGFDELAKDDSSVRRRQSKERTGAGAGAGRRSQSVGHARERSQGRSRSRGRAGDGEV